MIFHRRQQCSGSRISLLLLFVMCCCSLSTCLVSGFGQHQPHQQIQQRSISSSSSSSSSSRITASSSTQLHFGAPKIDDWAILKTGAVKGTVSNHPTLPDGYEITTSPLDVDKDKIKNNALVVTVSGSKYKLLTGAVELKPARATLSIFGSKEKSAPAKEKEKPAVAKKKSPPPAKAKPVVKKPVVAVAKKAAAAPVVAPKKKNTTTNYDLNGKVVGGNKGDNKQYLLVGNLIRSSSKRSQIYYAYEADKDGQPSGNRLTVKLASNTQRLVRENKNYDRVANKGRVAFSFQGGGSCFVRKVDFILNADLSPNTKGTLKGSAALVLESGDQNLRTYLSTTRSGLTGSALRKAAVNVCRCVEAMHSAGLVWTDLKAENFVLTDENNKEATVKGIDLESAVPIKSTPEDYSPEACPPEFAQAEKAGRGFDFRCDKNYDSWSVGMLLFELSTGKNYFKGKSEGAITNELAIMATNTGVVDGLDAVKDDRLRDLIGQCLSIDPRKRPSIGQILLHPYFLTTGIGPFTF